MGPRAAALGAYARFIVIAFVFSFAGCASVGTPGSGRLDSDGLNNALNTNDVRYVRSAVEAGVSPNQRIAAEAYPDGAPLIAIAARAASLDVIRYLIKAGADVNGRTPVNETPLMLAAFFYDETQERTGQAFERHEQAVRLLVSAGADLENFPYHYTPLAYAAYRGNERVVRYLIERGARVNADAEQRLTYVNTPLMMAAIQGHERIARSLLRAGADAAIRVRGGHTASELAAKYQHAQLARLLQCAEGGGAGRGGVGAQACGQLLGYDSRDERISAAH
jgi:ankyrin repeat protein